MLGKVCIAEGLSPSPSRSACPGLEALSKRKPPCCRAAKRPRLIAFSGSDAVVSAAVMAPEQRLLRPDADGRFGKFGGKYVPETLIAALTEVEEEFKRALTDKKFQARAPRL